MHTIGTYVSDAGVPKKTTTSISMNLSPSKKYSWSKDYGNEMCFNLGRLGILAHRLQDVPGGVTVFKTESGSRRYQRAGKYKWASENSPIIRWIHRSCLGLDDSAKTYQRISADWIIRAPENIRKAFLQGLSDGDGSVSLKGRYICITTWDNQKFVRDLFKTFDVDARINGIDVVTRGMAQARKAALIPAFRYAKSRLHASERLAEMIEMKRSIRNEPFRPKEIAFVKSMSKRGHTPWDVSQAFLDRFGCFVNERTIATLMRRSDARSN